MFANTQPLVNNGSQPGTMLYGQPQGPHDHLATAPQYYAPVNNGGAAMPMGPNGVPATAGAAFYPAQQFPVQQQQQQPVGMPMQGGGGFVQVQAQPQPHGQQQAYGDPNMNVNNVNMNMANNHNNSASSTPPVNMAGAGSGQVVLSTFDMAPPTDVGSIPSAAPSEMDQLAQFLAVALQHRCEEMRPFERSFQSAFHSSRVPGISVWDYSRRIAKYSGCSPESFIVALVILDRYSQVTGIPLNFRNVHRLSITAVMVSAKLRDDIYYSNAYYASIGGVNTKELLYLELELLATIKWATWVDLSMYEDYLTRLRQMYGHLLPPTA